MEYTTLGQTGMEVSRICLGCMSFGTPDWREWVLEEEESHPVIDRAIDLGINFFDTANMYSNGESERILGNALEETRWSSPRKATSRWTTTTRTRVVSRGRR
jgi:aryl-alcohol dehydrogenase-like predicted oxidoreductase